VISGAQCYASNPHFAAQLRHSPPPGRRILSALANDHVIYKTAAGWQPAAK